MFRKSLIPIDGSKTANNALVKALQLAKIYGPHIEVLHVMTVTDNLPIEPALSERIDTPSDLVEEYLTQLRIRDERMLSEALEEAQRVGLAGRASSKLLIGKPADVILDESDRGDFDLIVIGNRGLSGLKEFVLGSVSHQIVDESKIPVLVVK